MKPPPKPKGAPDDLHEVERALSVLKGRHPEHERASREDQEARARRSIELEARARAAKATARSRRILAVAIGVPAILLFGFIGVFGRREMSRRARIDAVAESFRAFGYVAIETSLRGSTGALEVTAEAGCLLAVSTEQAPVRITRGADVTETAAPALFCTCTSERIGVTSHVGDQGGLALLRADAAVVGGSRAFAYGPFKPASTLRTDDTCAEASLDAWIDASRYPTPNVDDAWLSRDARRAELRKAGFRVSAMLEHDAPLVVLDVPKDSCVLATSTLGSDLLTLRTREGLIPDSAEGGGSVGRCGQAAVTMIVAREIRAGSGEVVVLVAPASHVAGTQGMREVAAKSGLLLAVSRVAAADRPWDAKQLLVASVLADTDITTAPSLDVPVDVDARVVALSFETPRALTPSAPPEVHFFCSPPLAADTLESLCVFSGPQRWRTSSPEAVGGVARSKLPFWLFTMQGVGDPAALKGIAQLLVLARALQRERFVPTTLEALTELPNGVEILGRTGEDAVVAVGVAADEPWVYPLTDGLAWSLDGEPRVVAVKPLARVTLTALAKVLPPKPSRRTVVFRRQTTP